MKISVIIPTLNEAANIASVLNDLQPLRHRGHEIVVIDGGSRDDTVAIVKPLSDHCLVTEPGRANQMQSGAQCATGDVLWFVHADSSIPADADNLLLQALAQTSWGGFPVHLSGRQRVFRVIERLMNFRSALTGILTGDQGIFVERRVFDEVGGFRELPIMEDIDLSTRLKQVARPVFAAGVLGTSSRRWETCGIVLTVIRMWALRLAFYVGVPARYLASHYV